MKKQNSRHALLDDTFEDAFSPQFQESLLTETLRVARRRARGRVVARSASGLAAIALCCAIALLGPPPEETRLTKSSDTSDTSLENRPDGEFVAGTTIRLASDQDLLHAIGKRPAAIIGSLDRGRVIFFDDL